MDEPRVLPLFDAQASPHTWSERMVAGEYAVLFANTRPEALAQYAGAVCVVLGDLAAAEQYAEAETTKLPQLRCNLYDHHGMGSAPVRVIAGAEGADKNFISSGFRRWAGGSLLIVGVVLFAMEWHADFRLTWAGTLGSRIAPVGAILLLTEIGVILSARRKKVR